MSTTWEEASSCPRDGAFTGQVVKRKATQEGQLVTLICPEDNCSYHVDGWVVLIRHDGSIPDKIDPRTREKQFAPLNLRPERQEQVLADLERQIAQETRPIK